MKTVFRIFFTAEGTRPFLVLLCLLLGAASEAAGISTLLPAITFVAGGDRPGSSQLNQTIRDMLQSAGITPTLENLSLLIMFFLIAKAALSFAALSYAGLSSARVSNNLRRRLIKAIFDARWSFYTEQSGGRFANALANDGGRAGDAYVSASQVVAYSVQVIAYALVGILIDWRLAIVGLIVGSLIAILTSRLVKVTRQAGYKQTDNTSVLTVHTVDMLNNMKPLKSMQRYDTMLAALGTTLRKIKRSLITREFARNGLHQGSDALVVLIIGIGAYFAHTLLRVPLPELALSGVVFMQVIQSTSKLQKYLLVSAQFESAYLRISELIAQAESQREDMGGKTEPKLGEGCRFENIEFSHGNTPVLRGVSFDIPARSVTVLTGPSGAGKTTIVDLLIGFHRAQSGSIYVGGSPLDGLDIRKWRSRLGYVPQELSLLHASIRDNITLHDAAISDDRVIAALELAGAGDFLRSLPHGLDTDVGEMGTKLSGGQRQRLSLARALVIDPELIIVDEVTSALDAETEKAIIDNISSLGGKFTILAITHRPAWTRIADRLYEVSGGQVIQIKPAGAGRMRKSG